MRHQLLAGGTEQLNRLNARPGEMAVDTEKMALRIYDGELQGGYEVLGTPPPSVLPGPSELIAGDLETGFYGEVGPDEFISYSELSSQVGLSAGTLHNQDESLWLKFSLDGVPAFVSKKTCRYDVSWDDLNSIGCIFGECVVEVGGQSYSVRSLKSCVGAVFPSSTRSGFGASGMYGSEWNRLLYPVHSGVHMDSGNITPHSDPVAHPFGSWAQYSDIDLNLHESPSGRLGIASWCQESTGESGRRLDRGTLGVTRFYGRPRDYRNSYMGFRPVLMPNL